MIYLLLVFGSSFAALAEVPFQAPGGGKQTVQEVVDTYLHKVSSRLIPRFDYAGVDWPPRRVSLVAFKDTRLMELWAMNGQGEWLHIKDYRLKGMSGGAGPKLREGDGQVPEGFYRIEALNPNSRFHLSLKLNYPNALDLYYADLERREDVGSDIFIHGKDVSSGCLAVGDNAVEELFVLTSLMGLDAVDVIISPKDFRFRPFSSLPTDLPDWAYRLSSVIAQQLVAFPLSEK